MRSNEIRIEIDVNVNCSTTSVTLYRWRIYKLGTRTLANLRSGMENLLDKKRLLLDPLSLEYGNYTAQIEVSTLILSRAG